MALYHPPALGEGTRGEQLMEAWLARKIDMVAVRATLRDTPLLGFVATGAAAAARSALSKVSNVKPPPPGAEG